MCKILDSRWDLNWGPQVSTSNLNSNFVRVTIRLFRNSIQTGTGINSIRVFLRNMKIKVKL